VSGGRIDAHLSDSFGRTHRPNNVKRKTTNNLETHILVCQFGQSWVRSTKLFGHGDKAKIEPDIDCKICLINRAQTWK
jgi:hypothetical protein